MIAADGYFQSASGKVLPFDIFKVVFIIVFIGNVIVTDRFDGLKFADAAEIIEHVFKRPGGLYRYAVEVRRLFGVFRRNDHFFISLLLGGYKHRKNSVDGSYPPVQRKFAEIRRSAYIGIAEFPRRLYQRDRYRKVEHRPFFFDFRGGEVDGYSVIGEFFSAVFDCRTHPLAALLYRRVGQTDYLKREKPLIYVRLDVDGNAVKTRYNERYVFCKHDYPLYGLRWLF